MVGLEFLSSLTDMESLVGADGIGLVPLPPPGAVVKLVCWSFCFIKIFWLVMILLLNLIRILWKFIDFLYEKIIKFMLDIEMLYNMQGYFEMSIIILYF